MIPKDSRCGSPRGYRIHCEHHEDACPPCAEAWYRYNKRATYLRETGNPLRVSSLGTHRRIRALMTLGYGLPTIAAHLGIATGNLSYKLQQPYVVRSTHDAVSVLFEQLAMQSPPTDWVSQRTRNIARKRGWAPPLAWDDIDNDEEPMGVAGKTCSVDGCLKLVRCRGWCDNHYKRWQRHGSSTTLAPMGRPRGSEATYNAVHLRLKYDRGKAADLTCQDCGASARTWSYDHGDPDELVDEKGRPFSLDLEHYQPRCVPCHNILDKQAKLTRTPFRDDPELDEAAIWRRMHGDKTVRLTKADAAEVVERCIAAGWAWAVIEQRTGINVQQHRERRAG